jgi:uncharacterized protein YndB with AHSA1/START domain
MSKSIFEKEPTDREIVVTRILDASREMVWKTWTELDHLVKWWGPRGTSITSKEHSVKPGGVWSFSMSAPDGTVYPNRIVYDEVVKNERLIYGHGDDKSEHFRVCVTFEDVDGKAGQKTRFVMRLLFPSVEARQESEKFIKLADGHSTFDRLREHVAKTPFVEGEFVTSREFDAPLGLMWKMWSEPEHLAQWCAPKGTKTRTAKMDFRPGGVNHYCMVMPDGNEMWGKSLYREISKPDRIVYVNCFSNEKGEITRHPLAPTWPMQMLTTVTLSEHEGKTTVTIRWLPIDATKEEQQTFDSAHAGMSQGWGGSFDQLADYLKHAAS